MKRWALLFLCAGSMVLASCQAVPPPRILIDPPTIDLIEVPSGPVVAGEPFTVTVTASDNVSVSVEDLRLSAPFLPWRYYWEQVPIPGVSCVGVDVEPQPVVSRQFTCTVATTVPNGTWYAWTMVADDLHQRVEGSSPSFEVIGASDDREGAVQESVEFSSNPVERGQPLRAIVRTSDENPDPAPVEFYLQRYGGVPRIPCGTVTPTQLTSTVQEWVVDCVVGTEHAAGTYFLLGPVFDLIGNYMGVNKAFAVI